MKLFKGKIIELLKLGSGSGNGYGKGDGYGSAAIDGSGHGQGYAYGFLINCKVLTTIPNHIEVHDE